MRGSLANHLSAFVEQVNIAIADAKEAGIVPTPELARERLNGLAAFNTESPEIDLRENRVLTTGTHEIPVKIYSPDKNAALPVLVFFHGGGHMCGDPELYDPMCTKMAIAGHSVVISVDYRLAPEHPYPAGLDDAEFVVKNYKRLLEDIAHNDHLVIGGDSAGGAICTSLTMRKVSDPTLSFDKQFLIYPSVDYTMSSDSMKHNGTGFFLEEARIKWYFDNYFHNDEDPKAVSPLYNDVGDSCPDTFVVVAGCDPLRDEGLAYAEKLREAGANVSSYQFENMIHAFMNIEQLVPDECAKLYELMGEFIKK